LIHAKIDATVFYTVLKMVSKVLDEVTLRFTEEGMRIRQLDMAEVSMVDAFIPVNWFTDYKIDGNGIIAIRTSDLVGGGYNKRAGPFKKPKKGAMLSLEQDLTTGEGRVKLDLSGLTMNITCFGGEAKELPLPKVNLTQKLLTKPSLLLEFAKEACHLTDTVRFISKNSELLLLVKGENSEMSKSLIYEDGDISDFSLKEDVNAAYDVNRFLKLVEASAGFDSVLVEFDHDLPLKLTYTFMGVADIMSWDQKAQVVFYQAPRVEHDDYTPKPPQEEPKPAEEAPTTPAPEVIEVGSIIEPVITKEEYAASLQKVDEKPKVEAYVCENCGNDIEEGKGKRLEDGDTWLCETCTKEAEEQEEPVVAEISQVPAPEDLICSSCGSHLGEKYFKSEDGKLLCEYCGKPKAEPVAVVDPLAAFRNRWSKK